MEVIREVGKPTNAGYGSVLPASLWVHLSPEEVRVVARTAYTDGACRKTNPGQCSAAWALYVGGVLTEQDAWPLDGLHTNNEAEYAALIGLLVSLKQNSIMEVTIHSDSALVVNQVRGVWQAREHLIKLKDACQDLMFAMGHKLVLIKGHAGIEGNELCDRLCNEVLDREMATVQQ